MKLLFSLFLIIGTIFCAKGQKPNYCNLLQEAFNNKSFLRLMRADTQYRKTILIVDDSHYFNDCSNSSFSNRYSSFKLSDKFPEDSQRYYRCLILLKDRDKDTSEYIIGIDNYFTGMFIEAYFKRNDNNQWLIEHFAGGSTSIFKSNTPEMDKAIEEANKSLHEH